MEYKLGTSEHFTITKNGTSVNVEEHTHGNITNAGALQTTDITIASGDKLVVTDASDSNKVARTSISFDGATITKALTQKGTFETFLQSVSNATQSAAGLMPADDKKKVDNALNLTAVSGATVTQTLTPNVFYSFGTVTSLTVTLGTPVSGLPNQYAFEFDSGSTAASVSLPASILWQDDEPEIEANKHYEISVRYAGNGNYYGLCVTW